MRLLVFLHRWLGIMTCLIFLDWFASGLVMMYAEMPELSEADRLAALPALDAAHSQLSAREAITRAGVSGVESIKLTSLFDRPVWRILSVGAGWATVFADDGTVESAFSAEQATALLQPFLPPGAHPRLIETRNEPDQWTLEGDYGELWPLYRFALDDSARTELYVASATGEVVLRTTARNRAVAWVGAIPHWIYWASIRKHPQVWRQLVIWLAGVGCAVSLLGITVGVWRLSISQRAVGPLRGGSWSPFFGVMRWHHWAGLLFGITAFTWVFSGLLSMEPGSFSASTAPGYEQAEAFSGPEFDPAAWDTGPARLLSAHPLVKEIQLHQVAGKPYYVLTNSGRGQELTDSSGKPVEPFSRDLLLAAAQRAVPQGKIIEETFLHDYDAYYYDREGHRSLPIWRLKFNDPRGSWLYVDPQRGAIAASYDRSRRLARWLYHGLHSWDFPFLWRHRPAWDIVVMALNGGGVFLSGTGVVIGFRRLRASIRR
jgi:PepSY-associated transmembrane protein